MKKVSKKEQTRLNKLPVVTPWVQLSAFVKCPICNEVHHLGTLFSNHEMIEVECETDTATFLITPPKVLK